MAKIQSAERVSGRDESDNFVFQRSLLAYHKAGEMVSGDVLEIGTGSGYGVSVIAPKAKSFVTIDKFHGGGEYTALPNVEYRQMNVPPLTGLDNNSFDFVIMFQVIEHIKRDNIMVAELHRVLRPGGKLIISTPNKAMSLTRNPWHIREYTAEQFRTLLHGSFPIVDDLGVFGYQVVMDYYEKNRAGVEKFRRWDIFGFERWLPRWLLQIPYDILNRMNRRRLLETNRQLTAGITMEDYSLSKADNNCFDLLFVAQK